MEYLHSRCPRWGWLMQKQNCTANFRARAPDYGINLFDLCLSVVFIAGIRKQFPCMVAYPQVILWSRKESFLSCCSSRIPPPPPPTEVVPVCLWILFKSFRSYLPIDQAGVRNCIMHQVERNIKNVINYDPLEIHRSRMCLKLSIRPSSTWAQNKLRCYQKLGYYVWKLSKSHVLD